MGFRKCSFCAEEILVEAKKCKHCGEFVNRTISMGVGAVFAAGVVIACLMARTAEGVTVVGIWAIFALLFARVFGRS
jgi:hypothetical protein